MVCDACKLLGGEKLISVLKEIDLGKDHEVKETPTLVKHDINGYINFRIW